MSSVLQAVGPANRMCAVQRRYDEYLHFLTPSGWRRGDELEHAGRVVVSRVVMANMVTGYRHGDSFMRAL